MYLDCLYRNFFTVDKMINILLFLIMVNTYYIKFAILTIKCTIE